MCQALASATGDDPQTAFTVGLLSVVDALLDCSLAEALAGLPLDQDVASALLRREGRLGDLFGRVLAYERGDFVSATRAPLDAATLTRAYLQAIEWSSALLGGMPA
jgi:EAL and modified HD-GYP domain-containing signal transduction protein